MEPFLGEIKLFAGNFAPVGWAMCDGSLLPIGDNDALFSLIGTTYGGDGVSTFAVPTCADACRCIRALRLDAAPMFSAKRVAPNP